MGRFQLRRILGQSRLRGGDSLRGDASVAPPATSTHYYLVSPTTFGSPLGEERTQEQRMSNRLARFFPAPVQEKNVFRTTSDEFTTREPLYEDTVSVWYGGHINEVSLAERDLLVAAGFTVNEVEE